MTPSVVLFVTGDESALRRVTALLAERGVAVVSGGSGAGPPPADVHPDVVIIDTQLDETDAVTLVSRFRKLMHRPRLLVLGDRANPEAAVAAARAGADDVVFRPIDPMGLPARIEGLLAHAALESAREHAQTLEFRNQEMESFIYIVTHDMKTPVVNVQGLIGLIEQDHGAGLPEQVKEYLGRLRRNADRLEELLRDLLEYPRKLRIVGPLQRHDSGAVASAALDGLLDLTRARAVEIVLAPDMPAVDCDPKRLQQVFHNLVENAVKHSQGQPSPRVEIGWTARPQGPLFHVRDNGPGIAKEHLKDVFRLFHRIPGTPVDGTGIGLAVTRQLVEAHGGEIWCESRVGAGSTFLFTLGAPDRF